MQTACSAMYITDHQQVVWGLPTLWLAVAMQPQLPATVTLYRPVACIMFILFGVLLGSLEH